MPRRRRRRSARFACASIARHTRCTSPLPERKKKPRADWATYAAAQHTRKGCCHPLKTARIPSIIRFEEGHVCSPFTGRSADGRDISVNTGAIIMAGGRGTRMRESGHTEPKPLVQIGGVPLIERNLFALFRHNFQPISV